jgi:hypothetical protein
MSRVLRRPMFRGGIADSEGVGITSGLMEPRQGYANGDFVARNPAEQARYDFLKKTLETYNPVEEAKKRLQSEIEANYEIGVDPRLNPRYSFLVGPQGLPYIEEQIKKEYAPLEKEFAQYKLKPTVGTSQLSGFTKPKEEVPVDDDTKLNNQIIQPQESDTDVMNRYMEMFKANLAGDKDELKSQRYFELAKFGLNLLGQPGGPPGGKRDLLGAIGRAGVPAIEGLSRISAEEKSAERQAKILGFQAALRELENPTAKKIQTLSKITGIPQSEIAKRELSSGQSLDKTINLYAQAFEAELGTSSAIKLGATLAASGINLSEISKLPKDKNKNIESDKLKTGFYYDEEGIAYRFKNGQLQPIIIKSGN